jgi:hypothetical protein
VLLANGNCRARPPGAAAAGLSAMLHACAYAYAPPLSMLAVHRGPPAVHSRVHCHDSSHGSSGSSALHHWLQPLDRVMTVHCTPRRGFPVHGAMACAAGTKVHRAACGPARAAALHHGPMHWVLPHGCSMTYVMTVHCTVQCIQCIWLRLSYSYSITELLYRDRYIYIAYVP